MEKYLGESVPKLGFGLMRLPKKDGGIDIAATSEMVDVFLGEGFTYFDTSWGYPGSEEAFKAAVSTRHHRSEYLLATKCPVWMTKDRAEARDMLNVSLERTGAGYIDYYLLHNIGETRTRCFDDYGMWELALEQKAQGLIRHLGFSFHDKAQVLDDILTQHPEMEFVQLQINYADWESPLKESRKCYETARRHGVPIVIMEPVKGGTLARLPQPAAEILKAADPTSSAASWGMRFAASLEGIVTVLSGMSNMKQLRDNIAVIKDFRALSTDERETLAQVLKVLKSFESVPCTSCGYCTEVCSGNIAIPGIFEAMNLHSMYGYKEAAQGRYNWNTKGHGLGRASDCLDCGACEEACPQHISIRAELAKAAALFER